MSPSSVKSGGLLRYMKLREAIDQFIEWKGISSRGSTVTGYAQDLKIFCLLLRNRDVEDIQLDDIMQVIGDMIDAGWTHASMMRKCMALRKLFEFLEMTGHDVVKKELVPVPQPEHTMPRVMNEKDYLKLLKAIPKGRKDARYTRNRAIIRMLWDTGVRVGELCSLNAEDIDLKLYKGVIRTEKNRGSRPFRPIFWTEATNICLRYWLKEREALGHTKDPALFTSVAGAKSGQRLTNKGVGEMLRRTSTMAKLPMANAHSFRHRMGHHIIKSGGSNSDVANILGHASLLSTFVYTQLSDRDVEERARKFST